MNRTQAETRALGGMGSGNCLVHAVTKLDCTNQTADIVPHCTNNSGSLVVCSWFTIGLLVVTFRHDTVTVWYLNLFLTGTVHVHMYVHGKYVYSILSIRERKGNSERRDSLKKGERSSMLLCTCTCVDVDACISCTRMHTYIQAAAMA